MNVQTFTSKLRSKKVLLFVGIALALIVIVALAWSVMRQAKPTDYSFVKDTALKQVDESQEKLTKATNTYLATFKAAQNATGSVTQAEEKAKTDHEAVTKAAQSARDAIKTLEQSRASNDGEVDEAIDQVVSLASDQVEYKVSLVDSYPAFQALFGGKDNTVCTDIFLGETASLTDRKDRLAKAAMNCYEAINELKKTSNQTLRDYALKTEKRLKLLQQDAAAVVETEKKYNQFVAKEKEYQQRLADAESKNASETELNKLKTEIEKTNQEIKDNNANLDYHGDRYLATVKEFPAQYEEVFSKYVTQKVGYFETATTTRVKVLNMILDDKLLSKS